MNLPLSGIRIVDLTRALSGPFCSMILADLGADVIKIEPTPNGDMIRTWGPFDRDISAYYLSTNRNKRGIAVNFRDPEGLALIKDLAAQSDVVLENFKPGVMENMGLDYDTLAQSNPGIILGSITGFGRGGPMGNFPGFDQIAQGYSGIMSLTGQVETGPTRVGVAIGDLTSGMWAAMGILAAIISRQHNGKGQHVETSLLASLVGLLSVQGQRYLSLHEIPEPTGNVHPVIAPYGVFATKDGPLNMAPATPAMWINLCELLDLNQLTTDPRFIDNAARMEHRNELQTILETKLKTRTKMEWANDMTKVGIPAGPINDLADVFADPQVLHCGLLEEVQHPLLGLIQQVALPIKLNQHDEDCVRRHPPLFGEHTYEVLTEMGYEHDALTNLLEQGTIIQNTKTSTAMTSD